MTHLCVFEVIGKSDVVQVLGAGEMLQCGKADLGRFSDPDENIDLSNVRSAEIVTCHVSREVLHPLNLDSS